MIQHYENIFTNNFAIIITNVVAHNYNSYKESRVKNFNFSGNGWNTEPLKHRRNKKKKKSYLFSIFKHS